ncbi:MAG: DNA/RNA non-specific endonuclease [Gemmatimonadales bacterium]
MRRLLVLLGALLPPRAQAQDLTGIWIDPRGNPIEISETAGALTLRSAGRTYEGTRSGGSLTVSRPYRTPGDIAPELFRVYGERLVGDRSSFSGTLDAQGEVLSLTLSYSDAIPAIRKIPVALKRRAAALSLELADGTRIAAEAGAAQSPALDGGRRFRVELQLAAPPASPPAAVTVRWNGGVGTVPVKPAGPPGILVSRWLTLASFSRRDARDAPSIPEANTASSRGHAAELFTGAWEVNQTTESGRQSVGAAVVSKDGRSVRLVLASDSGETEYRSLEMLATRDPSGVRHTLSIRFEEAGVVGEPEDDRPPPTPLFVPDSTRQLRFEAPGAATVPVRVTSLLPPPKRFRVALMGRSAARLAGAWTIEAASGFIGGGGQQSWSRGASIKGIKVLDDQGKQAAPPKGPATRTLFAFGENLPVTIGDALVLRSNDSLISYELDGYPDERVGSYRSGWASTGIADPQGLSALVLTARLKPGVLPGVKRLTINGTPGVWLLSFADARGIASFAHGWREGEFQPTATFMASDVGYLVIDDLGAVPHERLEFMLRKSGREGGTPLVLTRTGAPESAEYQSPPIRLFRGDSRFQSPPEDPRAVSIDVRPGDVLEAEPVDPTIYITVPLKPTVRIVDKPADLGLMWKEALRRVAACHGDTGYDFDTISRERAETYSKVILTELGSRKIPINKGDQAAAILIRDELVTVLESEFIAAYRKIADGDDPGVLRFAAELRRTGGKLWELIRGTDSTGRNPQAIRAGLRAFIAQMQGSVQRARAAGDCNVTELLVIAGHRMDQIVSRIVPRLVELADSRERQYWVPDFVAQGYVTGLHTTGAAVRALDEYAAIDDAYKAMALALVTGGAAFAASTAGYAGTAAYVALGGDLLDMAYFGGKGVMDYLEGRDLLNYAQGALPAAGEEQLAEAELAASEWYTAALGVLAPGLGGLSGLKQLKALRNSEAVTRGAAVVGRLDALDDARLARLTDAERADLAALYTDLQARRLGGGVLSDAERAQLARFDAYLSGGTGALKRELPDDLKSLPVQVDEALDGRTVRVVYDTDAGGAVTNVRIAAGKAATAGDIALHAGVVRYLQRYQGLAGRARAVLDRLTSLIRRRNPPPGSLAFEAVGEIEKLPRIIESRLQELRRADLDPSVVDDLAHEVEYLESQLRQYQRSLESWDLSPGRGYIAATSPPTYLEDFQKAEAVVTGSTTRATRVTADGGTIAVTADELLKPMPNSRYSANGYLYATDAQGRVSQVDGVLRLDPAPRNARQQSEVGRAGAARPSGYVYGESDDGGHLIGSRFNGAGEAFNMVPQNSALNQNGAWKQMENEWAAALEVPGQQVKLRIHPEFSGSSGRPDAFDISYEITMADGQVKTVTKHIKNTKDGT